MKRGLVGLTLAISLLSVSVILASGEEVQDSTQPETPESKADLSWGSFQTDLATGLDARIEVLSSEEAKADKEKALDAALAEWQILDKYEWTDYKDEQGKVTNEEYIRAAYLEGLKMQVHLQADASDAQFWSVYDKGFEQRAAVICEMYNTYKDYWKPDQEVLDAVAANIPGYSDESSPEIYQLQALLFEDDNNNQIDGKAGSETILRLKEKQQELGLPINGVVNADRVTEIVNRLKECGQSEAKEAANQRLSDLGYTDYQITDKPETSTENETVPKSEMQKIEGEQVSEKESENGSGNIATEESDAGT